MSRLIDADALAEKIEKLKESPWFNHEINGERKIRKEALELVIALCIKHEPTACDIEQISSARYNNGFYDGKKAMEEKLEQIRAEIVERKQNSGEPNRELAFNVCLGIIDKYTKGDRE